MLLDEEISRIAQVYPRVLLLPTVEACRFRNDANLSGALYHHMTLTGAISTDMPR